MIWYTITGPNTLVKHSDAPSSDTQFTLSGAWAQTVLPNGTPSTVVDSAIIADLNTRLTQLRPNLPMTVGFLFYGGVYHGPTAITQF